MRIEKIILNNFGSYEGETVFDTACSADKNIVLVGGKNGAGKTTLFTAMRVCLYGFMSMGYKNYNSYYIRSITKLINNKAKMIRPADAFVEMHISLSNGQELDHYVLRRQWTLGDSLTEVFTIVKNDAVLNSEEIADFEKYLLSLIPPELFNLYFFDGEKIADFFMNEGSNSRIKEAFLTLCGYDTFDIMRRNFKRISGGGTTSSNALDEYWSAKQEVETARDEYESTERALQDCLGQYDICIADIAALEKDYTQKGGITQEEWNQKIMEIKEEEKKRDSWNALLRKWANEIIPFLMIRDQVSALKCQIVDENNNQKYRNFCEVIDSPSVSRLLGNTTSKVKKIAAKDYGSADTEILGLSLEQSASLLAQIGVVLSFDADKVSKCRRAIKRSISKSAKIRQELDNSSVSAAQQYMVRKAELFELKSEILHKQVELEQLLVERKDALQLSVTTLSKTQSRLEAEIKKASINDISAKAIVMLDKLQTLLYRQQIAKVESFFRTEIRTLMRKTQFIDDIRISDDFSISLYRHETIANSTLRDILSERSQEHLENTFGEAAVAELMAQSGTHSFEGLASYFAKTDQDVTLPIKIDQASLSNGEKQIFIMALYHSLVQLGNHEIPFIIDTPFARIDTEHRRNISKYFFSKLKGQVFILSTNEEIDSDHVQIMRDKIASTFMLENSDNKKTVVQNNTYF